MVAADLKLIRTCAALSQAAYGNEQVAAAAAKKLGLSVPTWFTRGDTEVFVCHDALRVFVSFRGTSSKRDIRTDLRALRVKAPLAGTCHRGFLGAFKLVQDELQTYLARLCRTRRRVIYTGHSLGGALATLAAAAHLGARITGDEPPELVTCGSPRVGCSVFARALDARLKVNLRLLNNNDAPGRVPWWWFGPLTPLLALLAPWLWRELRQLLVRPACYRHVGQLLYLTRGGELLTDPALHSVELDRALGRMEALLWALLDGARDHGIAHYVTALEALEE